MRTIEIIVERTVNGWREDRDKQKYIFFLHFCVSGNTYYSIKPVMVDDYKLNLRTIYQSYEF